MAREVGEGICIPSPLIAPSNEETGCFPLDLEFLLFHTQLDKLCAVYVNNLDGKYNSVSVECCTHHSKERDGDT